MSENGIKRKTPFQLFENRGKSENIGIRFGNPSPLFETLGITKNGRNAFSPNARLADTE
jgi:hypothetical protein